MSRFHRKYASRPDSGFRSKQCPFWVNFGYVVPGIKYAPKLVELISNNGYGLAFMKSGRALAVKIIDIDRQHTPTARLCSPRAVRSRKERRLVSWTQTMHKSYFLAFFAYLGFQVANIFTSVYWPSELVTKINASLSSWSLEGFQIFEISQTLDAHGVWFSQG